MEVVCNTGINLLDVVVYGRYSFLFPDYSVCEGLVSVVSALLGLHVAKHGDTQGAAPTQDNGETRGGWAACHPKDA